MNLAAQFKTRLVLNSNLCPLAHESSSLLCYRSCISIVKKLDLFSFEFLFKVLKYSDRKITTVVLSLAVDIL